MPSKPASATRILDTALELFSTRGYEATSVREICEAAGISKPTLYYFYGSKEGVYRALVQRAMNDVGERVAADLARPEPLIDRMKTMTRWFFDDVRARRKLWRFVAMTAWSPELVEMTEHLCSRKQMDEVFAQALDEAVARGEITPGPASLRMMLLKGAMGEAIDAFLLFGEPPLTRELADQLIDMVWAGWRPVPPASIATTADSSSSSVSSSSSSASTL